MLDAELGYELLDIFCGKKLPLYSQFYTKLHDKDQFTLIQTDVSKCNRKYTQQAVGKS